MSLNEGIDATTPAGKLQMHTRARGGDDAVSSNVDEEGVP
jgi:hypothetical protein